MKRIVICLIFTVLAIGAWAQGGDGVDRRKGHEQLEAQKVAYITEKLGLTPSESEKFWPIYNQYWTQRRSIARAKREVYKQIETQTAGDTQIASIVRLQREEADVIERYAKMFETVVSVDKTAKFFVAEESFKGYLVRRSVAGDKMGDKK